MKPPELFFMPVEPCNYPSPQALWDVVCSKISFCHQGTWILPSTNPNKIFTSQNKRGLSQSEFLQRLAQVTLVDVFFRIGRRAF